MALAGIFNVMSLPPIQLAGVNPLFRALASESRSIETVYSSFYKIFHSSVASAALYTPLPNGGDRCMDNTF
jgi:hypothetical protein